MIVLKYKSSSELAFLKMEEILIFEDNGGVTIIKEKTTQHMKTDINLIELIDTIHCKLDFNGNLY
jgi:hypothetical protein